MLRLDDMLDEFLAAGKSSFSKNEVLERTGMSSVWGRLWMVSGRRWDGWGPVMCRMQRIRRTCFSSLFPRGKSNRWKLTGEAVVKFRSRGYPNLLLDGGLESFQK